MNLDIFNNLGNNIKGGSIIQKFLKELANSLERKNNSMENSCLKKEDETYQVLEVAHDGVYLQNVKSDKVEIEKDIPKNMLKEIGTDTVLKYQNGKYVIDEKLTDKFLNNLTSVSEYNSIKKEFIEDSNILNNDINTEYTIKEKNDKYSILEYEENGKHEMKVPNSLISFWSGVGEKLYFNDEQFKRKYND